MKAFSVPPKSMVFFRSRSRRLQRSRRSRSVRPIRSGYRKKFSRISTFARKQRQGRIRHYLKRSFTGTINLQAAIDANPHLVGSQFTLQQLPNYTEFTNLFDNYRIHAIKMTFFRPSVANSASEMDQLVRLHTAIDYDDAATPASINELMNYDNYQVIALRDQFMRNGKFSRFWRPRIVREVYRTAVSTAYEPARPKMLDCAYPDIPHYGIKWALEMQDAQPAAVTMPADMTLQYTITYYMSFGNTH